MKRPRYLAGGRCYFGLLIGEKGFTFEAAQFSRVLITKGAGSGPGDRHHRDERRELALGQLGQPAPRVCARLLAARRGGQKIWPSMATRAGCERGGCRRPRAARQRGLPASAPRCTRRPGTYPRGPGCWSSQSAPPWLTNSTASIHYLSRGACAAAARKSARSAREAGGGQKAAGRHGRAAGPRGARESKHRQSSRPRALAERQDSPLPRGVC